jgi:endonuclease/exonuclease/phosphatase family metal-dependent hydrolase
MSFMVAGEVRAMTWNIWWRFGPHWRDRQPAIQSTLEDIRPDVLALQEVWGDATTTQADELAERLELHAVFTAPSFPSAPRDSDVADWQGVDLGIAVLSRWPVLGQEVVPLPARHRSWEPGALVVRLDHPTGPLPLVATCLEHSVVYADDRMAQAALVAELATQPRFDGPCPVLLMGDLNAAVGSAAVRPISDVLTDAWTAGGGAADAITLPSTHPSASLGAGPQLVDQRIDHIFFRPGREGQEVRVDRVRLVGDAVEGIFPSDHRAVVADLTWSE